MFSFTNNNNRKRNKKKDKFIVPHIRDPLIYYVMPPEEEIHEGTWLQWPHNYGWDDCHIERYEKSWIEMTKALIMYDHDNNGEKVFIIVFNNTEQERIYNLLKNQYNLNMSQIMFYIWPTDDVWVRDNGPIFVFEKNDGDDNDNNNNNSNNNNNQQQHQKLCISNWLFNGWGNKADDYYDNYIPLKVGHVLDIPVIDIPMVLEGGSIEVDGRGTLMAKKSCILNDNRNKGWKQHDVEIYFHQYLGITNFIWLEGTKNNKNDITDDHIDGTARFANGDAIVTFYKKDFINPKEYDILQNACDVNGKHYDIVHLPCTKNRIKKANNEYGIYVNYYVGNKVVLVPSFDDPNDIIAADKVQQLYPNRNVVSIPFTEVYCDGGLIHCVTQQQPKQNR